MDPVRPTRRHRYVMQSEVQEIRRMAGEGLFVAHIAKALDRPPSVIRHHCQANGIAVPRSSRGRRSTPGLTTYPVSFRGGRRPRPVMQSDIREMRRLAAEGLCLSDIAKTLDRSTSVVKKHCEARGIALVTGQRGRPRKHPR